MSYGMDGWNHDNDLVRRKDVMDSLVKEYNRRFSLGERNGLHLAWIEKAVNEVDVAQQGKTQLPEEDATKGATSDLISREAALKAVRLLQTYKLSEGDGMLLVDKADVLAELMKMPSAQLERKTGKWINEGVYGEGHAQCSIRCNNPLCNFHYIGYLGDYNFCPNCGADMREASE